MGLGLCMTVSLKEARDRALECRKLREQEIDPIAAREAARRQAAMARAKALTFNQAAASYMGSHRVAWKNDKHAAQWAATLKTYAYPVLGEISVQAIDTTLIMKVIKPILGQKPETANRLRGRIELAAPLGNRARLSPGRNPRAASFSWHLDKQATAMAGERADEIKHHSALPYAELPAFLVALRAQDEIAARALEFTILTAARTGETIGARRSEFNPREKLWTVPAERMKASKEHRVPAL